MRKYEHKTRWRPGHRQEDRSDRIDPR